MKDKKSAVKTALIIGFAAAVSLSAARGETPVQKQTFLFPQFTSSAAAERNGSGREADTSVGEKSGFVYAFKIAELIEKWFM